MKKPLYRKALSHSWGLAWKHVWLWPLGLFAALLGQMGIVDFFAKLWISSSGSGFGSEWLLLPHFFELFSQAGAGFPVGTWGWLAFLAVVFLGFGALFLFVSVVSQGALVHITSKSMRRKKLPDVGPSWHAGVSHFWRIFGVHVLKKIVIAIVAVWVGFSTINMIGGFSAIDVFTFFVMFILASFIGIVVSFMSIYAVGYIVVEEHTFLQSVKSAWWLFVTHWMVSIEVGFIIFILNILLGLVLLTTVFLFLIPAFITYFFAVLIGHSFIFSVGLILSAILYLLFVFLVSSVFSVFTTSTWTYLFMKMHKNGVLSRFLHWHKK